MRLLSERVETPFGQAFLHLDGLTGSVRLTKAEANPTLPQGMTVDGVVVLDLIFDQEVTEMMSVQVTAGFGHSGSPECGEWLECISFDMAEGRLSIGYRDVEWFSARNVRTQHADFQASSMTTSIQAASPGFRFPVSFAWRNQPIPSDASTWFAADLALPG